MGVKGGEGPKREKGIRAGRTKERTQPTTLRGSPLGVVEGVQESMGQSGLRTKYHEHYG